MASPALIIFSIISALFGFAGTFTAAQSAPSPKDSPTLSHGSIAILIRIKSREGAKDRGEYRQAAGAISQVTVILCVAEALC
jgi:hypothetical protein